MPIRDSAARWSCIATLLTEIGCSTPALTELPENPCELLSVKQVAAAAGVEISGAERVLSQQESLESGQPGHQRAAGSICRYDSPTPLVSIAVIVPDRRGPLDSRSEPARCRAAREPVDSSTDRIWRAGGASAVCVGARSRRLDFRADGARAWSDRRSDGCRTGNCAAASRVRGDITSERSSRTLPQYPQRAD
jgi:hypothetical protein